MELEQKDLTAKVIGAAIEVQRVLGIGFLERVYENAMAIELRRQKIGFEKQSNITLFYCNEKVGEHRLDLLIEDQIVVELKAVKVVTPEHFAIVRSYLRAAQRKHGLLLNFGKLPLGINRVIADS